jgi:hypothetical protein
LERKLAKDKILPGNPEANPIKSQAWHALVKWQSLTSSRKKEE